MFDAEASFNYSEWILLSVFKKLEPSFGPWNGYYYAYDLNQDGEKEVFAFSVSGSGLPMMVLGIQKGKLVLMADTSKVNNVRITVDVSIKSFMLHPATNYEDRSIPYPPILFCWNSQNGKYIPKNK